MSYLGMNPSNRYPIYENLHVPTFATIPMTDITAWTHFENHRWVYDKMRLAESQNIECGPLGILPSKFPVFLKPIYNLYGGSISAYKIDDVKMYNKHQNFHPGRFWMEFLEGDHIQHDLAIHNGEIYWSYSFLGKKYFLDGQYTGAFDHWKSMKKIPTDLENHLDSWVANNMEHYTGFLNLETIGLEIIEVHLRPGLVVDLADVNIMDAIIKLYGGKGWALPKKPFKPFYIFSIFGGKDVKYIAPTDSQVEYQMGRLGIDYFEMELEASKRTPPLIKRVGWLSTYNYHQGINARNWIIKKFRPTIPKKMRDSLIK